MEKSADDLEFSAEGLYGNAKTIKFALLEEPALQFVTIYVQVLLNSQMKKCLQAFPHLECMIITTITIIN